MSVDITFITNEPGNTLRGRFAKLLGTDNPHQTDAAGLTPDERKEPVALFYSHVEPVPGTEIK